MTDVKIVEMDEKSLKVEDKGLKILPNRDDIEIPGMEDASSTGTKTPVIKQPKTAFTLPVEEIQAQSVQMVIDVDRVKEAVSKLPGFKLPKGDTVGLPAHQEITKTDVNAERVNVKVDTTVSKITDIKAQLDTYVKKTDINASPEKLSRSSVTTIKLPKNTLSDLGAHEPITMTEIYHKKRKEEAGRTNEFEIQIELHKREDVEIPGMENIHQKGSPSQLEREKELAVPVPEWSTIKAEETNVIPYTKGLDKKSKKAKMPMPGFGITQLDSLLGGQFSETQLSVNGEATSVDIKGGAIDIDDQAVDVDVKTQKLIEEQDRELKLPKFGISLPKVKGAESFSQKKVDVNGAERRKDIQASEVDVSLAKRNGEVLQPDVHIKAPEIQDEVKDTVGSPSRFKMPTLKFPKFGAAAPKVAVDVPDVEKDIKVQGTEIPEPKLTMSEINIEKPSVDIKGPSIDMDVNLKKLEMFTLPEVKVQVLPPSVELKVSSGEVEITEGAAKSRMSFPKIGFSKPEVKAQEVDITLSEVDISLPEGKVEFKEPEVEMKTPEIQVDVKDTVGSPSRFKMPTLKFPKFGAASPNVTIEVPDFEKDIKVHGTEIREPKLTISAINIERPSVDLKGPSIDVNVNRKKNENVTLPEVKMNVQPPSIELKVPSGEVEMPEGAATEMDVKMKKPRMSFGWFSKPEMKAPKVDISLTNVDISLPEGKVEVKEPDVELKSPEVQIEMKHDIELEGQGSKFKLPKFGLSLPTVKGPEIGLSLSKTDVDVNLPEGRADLQLPDVEVGRPSVEVEIPEAGSKDIDVKMRKPTMSFPKFGFSKPDVKAPEVDISLPEVDISLPEGKVEVKEPELEMKTPEIQVDVKDTVGSPSRFKMPTLKFPKFGVTSPNVTIEVPDLDKDIKVHGTEIPEPKLTTSVINIEKPSVDLKGPSIDVNRKKNENVTLPEVKMNVQPPSIELKVPSGEVEMPERAATEMDVKMKNPRMSFGWFSKPEMKAPEVDISLTNVDISLPEGKVEVKEPDVELKSPEVQIEMKHDIELEGQGSQFKLPKFGLSLPRVKGPEIGLSLSKTDVDVDLPEGRADLQLPDVEVGRPSVEVEIPEAGSKDIDVKMRKPRMSFPKFGFSKPEVTAPEVDISLPEVDISLPEGKVDVKEPELEMKTPEIQVDVKDTVGSPFKIQNANFKIP
ncbi:neuroblast differentiation-associated protein AHNAK isoform X1 [Salmo salar]|uniref:Neuroblast differentiation-associated protein AHNAK isoform X1 n=1 Tax=Salmo salar TaxID=8030 RepID=A0ABM3EP44_SALSA|nr:neuroblast differentiation-associated protein AHNAK isoform X1 [Salmo salar]